MLQDKNGIQYMVTSDGSDIVPQNGNSGLQTSAAVQYMQVSGSGSDWRESFRNAWGRPGKSINSVGPAQMIKNWDRGAVTDAVRGIG